MNTQDHTLEAATPKRSSILGKLLLGLLVCLFLCTLTYTVVRESKDAWLWKHLTGTPVETPIETSEEIAKAVQPVDEAIEVVQIPEVAVVLNYEGAEDSLKKELLLAQSTLTLAMEDRLKARLTQLQEAYDDQRDRAMDVQTAVNELVGETLQQFNEEENGWEPGRLIDDIRNGLTALQLASNDLDRATQLSEQTYKRLMEMGEVSGTLYNEHNYNFKTYQVGRNETLLEITNNVQNTYAIPDANLSFLISIFNDVTTGPSRQGNRRATKRVVLNEELRIPVPKDAGELAADFKLPEIVKEQQQVITAAQEEQQLVSGYLSESIGSLRSMVERMEAVKELAILIQETTSLAASESFVVPASDLTDEQRQAWNAFNEAMNVFEFGEVETESGNLNQLRDATRGLMQAYVSNDSELPSEESLDRVSDIHWFKEFIQRYDPEQSSLDLSSIESTAEEL